MTAPRPTARRIDDVAAPYGNFLVRVPAAGDDVCLIKRLNIDQFDVLTTVPSSTGRTTHPLRRLAADLVIGTADRHQDLLTINQTDIAHRAHTANRYRSVVDLRGARVLLIDDTWTTGAHAQSASAALKAAGAVAVAVVAIGRWVNPDYGNNKPWLAKHRRPGWNWTECCLEADARR